LEKALGPEHLDVAGSLNNLALLYLAQGQHVKAEPLYQQALEIREKALGAEHPNVATSLTGIARLYAKQGQYAKAELLYQRTLQIREKFFGPEHPGVAASLNGIAGLYVKTRRIHEGRAIVPPRAGDLGKGPGSGSPRRSS
jgi:tetratricopeptide (TPR) repeat protein